MLWYFNDEFLENLYNCIAGILSVLKIFKAESEYQVHISIIQFTKYLQITGRPVLIQQHRVRQLSPITMGDF